jgi:hypothetical protein
VKRFLEGAVKSFAMTSLANGLYLSHENFILALDLCESGFLKLLSFAVCGAEGPGLLEIPRVDAPGCVAEDR